MRIRVPKILQCPFCLGIFERGKLVQQFTCPFCRRYIKLPQVKRFFRRKIQTYHPTLTSIEEVDEKEKERILNSISKKYEN